MSQALELVSLVVRDYDEALAFYVGTLGFDLVEDTPVPEEGKRWVVVRPPGARSGGVLLARAANEAQRARVGDQTGGRVFLFLHTDDFERDYRAYESRGVAFVRPPRDMPYGRVAVFRDLYGNLWDLVQPEIGLRDRRVERGDARLAGAPRDAAEAPLVVYGTTASYFTGKLEAYLRAKGIPYRLEPFNESNMRRSARHTGVVQVPQVECPDGSWLVDTTLIIEYFERVRPEPAVTPREPAVAFVARLLEDYADEWLWRPAMHYRWSYPETARLMSAWLAEHVAERRAPEWLKRWYWRRRQYGTFVAGDGVTAETRAAVEASYLETLDALEAIFARRPYVLGGRPTEADFGFFGPLFRHFFSDPAPARIMRDRAPGVQEWVARMWNLRPERLAAEPLPARVAEDLGALLHAVVEVYLPYLDANARAYAQSEKLVRYDVRGTAFAEPVKPYRVWCRDRLGRELAALDADARAEVQRVLGTDAVVERLATPSPRPAGSVVAALPIQAPVGAKPVDSWWRG